ncbi:MAG: translation initiation factor eIF-1A [Candidatus Micrarchaeota archaeon]
MAGRGGGKFGRGGGGKFGRGGRRGKGAPPEGPIRVRLPREGEVLATVLATVGGGRLQVSCKDGKERLARIPGKIRRNIWVRPGDIVLIKPWAIQGDIKADVVWRYNHLQADYLRRNGYI